MDTRGGRPLVFKPSGVASRQDDGEIRLFDPESVAKAQGADGCIRQDGRVQIRNV